VLTILISESDPYAQNTLYALMTMLDKLERRQGSSSTAVYAVACNAQNEELGCYDGARILLRGKNT
jgi:hypothetical protein